MNSKIKLIVIFIMLYIDFIYAQKVIKIDLSAQKLYAMENGEILFSGSISSGKKGYRTPRGTFRVIDKERYHISNKYPRPNGGAKMPYMLRLTNYGLAIHQGFLPGYPASHGCIRVSKDTAIKLWYWAKRGTKVIIYGDAKDFRYVKKKKSSKKYSKKKSKKRRYTKRRYSKKRYVRTKKRYKRKTKLASKKRYKKTVYSSDYEVVELYDTW